jgi:hypothetical protein
MVSEDPEVERRAADIVGLYLNPPQHAAIFCVDEKSASQVLDRFVQCCRCRPVGSNAVDSGTKHWSLYAALNVRTRKVQGKAGALHTGEEFVAFAGQIVTDCEPLHRSISSSTTSPPISCEGADLHRTTPERTCALRPYLFFLAESS